MSLDAWPIRARLAIGRGDCKSTAVTWRAAGARAAHEEKQPILLSAAADLIAVQDDGNDAAELEIADVIWRSEPLSSARSAAWLAQTLDRYPGSVIAAAGQAHQPCMVAGRAESAIQVTVDAVSDGGCGALACALFCHGWLLSGWRLDALEPPHLSVSRSIALGGPGTAHPTVAAISFAMSYIAGRPRSTPVGDAGLPSRRRASSASGAPTAS